MFLSSIFFLEFKNLMNLNIKRNRFELAIDMKVSNLLAQPFGGSEGRWKYSYQNKYSYNLLIQLDFYNWEFCILAAAKGITK